MSTVMRDASMPTIWGVHPEAQFNPIVVREQLVSTVEGAPAEWEARLDDLGFKKGSRAWLRLGPITESEFQYLSPAIVLKGFRTEDLVGDGQEPVERAVPAALQDEIANLWQKNLDAILFELSFHGVTSKAAAWSHVEAAIEGDSTPGADAVVELAFARMLHEGRLTGDSLEYAVAMKWEGVSRDELLPRGKQILGAGDSINWADTSGIVKAGRLASPLRAGDKEAWVYEHGPRFVGGICASTLGRIDRHQIQYFDAGETVTLAIERPQVDRSLDVTSPTSLDFSNFPVQVLNSALAFVRNSIYFPEDRWRSDLALAAQDEPELAEVVKSVEQVLTQIEGMLQALSQHYYGSIGVGFCLGRSRQGRDDNDVMLRLGNYNEHGFYTVASGVKSVPVMDGAVMDLGISAVQVDIALRATLTAFEMQTQALGHAVGVDRAVPLAFCKGHKFTNALSYIGEADLGASVSLEQLMLIAAVSSDRFGVAKESIHGPKLGSDTDLKIFSRPVPNESVGVAYSELSLGLTRATLELVDLSQILAQIKAGPTNASIDILRKEVSFAHLSMWRESSGIAELTRTAEGISNVSGTHLRFSPHVDHEAAAKAMLYVIDHLKANGLAGDNDTELDLARRRVETFTLLPRLHMAIEATRQADNTSLMEWVKNEMMRSYQGRISGWSEDAFKRACTTVANEMRGGQGVVVAVGISGKRHKLTCWRVRNTDDAVVESRDATLGRALVEVKERYRLKAKFAVFDAVAFCDPELCALLAGERSGIEKVSEKSTGAYQDTGVVAGYARKDIRGFGRDDLLAHALRMSPEQKAIYIKREMIWPRVSFEEMKEQGIHLRTAIAIDTLWKAMPKAPKSLSLQHVTAFADLVVSIRDGVSELVGKLKRGELQDSNQYDTKHINGSQLDAEFRSITHRACFAESVRESYQHRDLKIRGMNGFSLRDYMPFTGSRAMRELLDKATWDDYLKSKKVTRLATGSRVARDEVVRIGEDHRKGVSVTSEDFLRTFGFSGVEYGNWTNQREREKHLNFSYDSMMDFARQMHWEPMALSLGGRLGLCIGSRGQGGSGAVAHFEPANYAMNLTRMSGDGSLAHEYFHALANHYGHIHTGKPQDLLETFGYALQRKGPLPVPHDSNLRESVRTAFRDLQVAIMRKPAPGADDSVIDNYTELSDMMKASLATSDYYAEPCEMFARAMEIWFADQLAFQGKRNDYLVRAGKGGEVYPDAEHLQRINRWVSPLLEAIELEVRTVSHPMMGDIQIPVLHSEARAHSPMTPKDLVELAGHELNRLFAQSAPKLMLFGEEGGKAGFYRAALDVIGLNERFADKETIYHEAWHACEAKLLTARERDGLREAFSPNSALGEYVVDAMRQNGLPELAVTAALGSPAEMQAYAFQLWAVGKLDLTEQRISEFFKVRGFIDDVSAVASLLGAGKAEGLFNAFMKGELAVRSEHQAADRMVSVNIPLQSDDQLNRSRATPSPMSMR
jgi:hypothetical protein